MGGKKFQVGKHLFRVLNIINIYAANLMNEETKRKFEGLTSWGFMLSVVSYLTFCTIQNFIF